MSAAVNARRQMQATPVVLVLASGRGERFLASGGSTHKLDALFGDKTVLQHTMANVIASGLPYHLERSTHAGMGDSLKAAVQNASVAYPSASAYLVLPADMPLVQPELLRLIASEIANSDTPIVYPAYLGERGHPVGFSRSCESALMGLSGDQGARALLDKFEVKKINVNTHPFGYGCRIDIDTVSDLAAATQLLSKSTSQRPA